ncbi:hypothetical protein RIR_e34637_A0A2I1FWC0_9GLOM [Rhizophagus irregularis DAOM 181602=DAOM 197198]|nr:hypothetical protein RIR_e34637_A0A2I1FWC0_9GLOM [Rhizophagus irregularis DAOM 181602=DAOM 197198]
MITFKLNANKLFCKTFSLIIYLKIHYFLIDNNNIPTYFTRFNANRQTSVTCPRKNS